jgi:hypothetical protein
MSFSIGLTLALVVGAFARWIRLDRDDAFYPTITIVIASYYVLFAAMAGSGTALAFEIVLCLAFVALAVAGFKRSLWYAVAALAAHGVTDFFHTQVITDGGVPAWWPGFCGAYDVTAAVLLAFFLTRPKTAPASTRSRGGRS